MIGLLLVAVAAVPNASQLNAIKHEITVTEKQISYEDKKVAKLKKELKDLNRKIEYEKRNIEKKKRYSKTLDSRINRTASEKELIKRLKREADNQTKESIKKMYEYFVGGKSSSDEFIVKNLTMLYFLYKDRLLKKLSQAEKKKERDLLRLEKRKQSVERIKRKIENEMRKESELVKKRKRLAILEIKNKNRLIMKKKHLLRKKNYLERILKQLAKKKRYTKKIANLPSVRIGGKNPFLRYKGRMSLPVKGKVEKRFGIYKDSDYNVYTRHTGIRIAARANSYVRAVAYGKVVYAGIVLGYGKTVIIRHSGNFFTIYGSLKRIKTKRGTMVKGRSIIGIAGAKPVYFGIRYKDKAINPEGWIRRLR